MFLHRRENGYWYLWYWDTKGRKQKISTSSRYKSEALEFAKNFVAPSAKRKAILFSQFITEYDSYSAAVHTSETRKIFHYTLTHLNKFAGNITLSEIDPSIVERFLAEKIRNTSAANARKYYQHLRSAFETAVKWGYCRENPFARVAKPKPPQINAPFFTPEDFRIFLDKVPDQDFKDLCTFAFLTGLRLNELLHLEWKDVDFVRALVVLQNKIGFTTKNKLTRNIPIGDELIALLQRRQDKAATDLLFTEKSQAYNPNKVSKRFKEYVKLTKLDQRLHFHSLRHSFCSNLVRSGVSLYIVQRLAGHSSPTVTQGYSHLQPELMHDVVNSIKVGLN